MIKTRTWWAWKLEISEFCSRKVFNTSERMKTIFSGNQKWI
jgi:hypothetical protein